MRVRVSFTLEVDHEVWATEYGLDPDDKPAIREDVQNYAINGTADWPVPVVVVR